MWSALRWTTLAVLVTVCYTAAVKSATRLSYESCGPPFNLTVSPNPPKFGHELNITLEFVAAYDMIVGDMEVYLSTYPYHYKEVYCADGRTIDPQGCYIFKGEQRVMKGSTWLDNNFKEKLYTANGTIRNEDGKLLLCIRFKLEL